MFEDAFTEMLLQYPDAVRDKKVFIGLLKDFFPEQQMQVNLVSNLFVMGIAEDIQRAAIINNVFAYRYVKALADNYGVSRLNADWAVSVWCVCYGRNALHKECEIKLGTMKPGQSPVIRDGEVKGQQYNDLFQYVKRDAGYEVSGFTGNKKTIIFQNQFQNHAITAISDFAFKESEVEEVIMTEGYQRIGKAAFQGCAELKQVVLSETLKEIMPFAFQGCASLGSIVFPSSLQMIGEYAFSATDLRKITIPSTVYWTGKGVLSYCEKLATAVLPENMQEIPDEMFLGCIGLRRIEIPDRTEKIGKGVFKDCINLDSVTIPDSVDWIGEDAFENVHDKFILQCSMGSYAEQYARSRKIKYQLV